MNKIVLTIFLFLCAYGSFAQAPQGIPYQAVARNSSGAILASTAISVRFTIRDSVATGTIKYRETFSVTTTSQGMFSVNVGQGSPVTGTFSGINWGTNAKFMQVELDPAGGTSYIDMGTQQMMSVPYALFSGSTYGGANWKTSGNNGINSTSEFLGTTDNVRLAFRINNTHAGELNPTNHCISLGEYAAVNSSTGLRNIAIGLNSLNTNSTVSDLIAIGDSSLFSQVGGSGWNIAIGSKALKSNTTGYNNTALGIVTLLSNTTGVQNTALGAGVLRMNTTGDNNTGCGTYSLALNTTGQSNTAIGSQSINQNTTGYNNTGTGVQSLYSNTTGYNNTALGFQSLHSNTTGYENTSVGQGALATNSSGTFNTAVGEGALSSNSTGHNNTSIGGGSMGGNVTGTYNTGVGVNSLLSNVSGTNLSAIGFGTDVIGSNLNNASALGTLATVNASNKVVIGNSGITTIGGYANWSNLSDGRFKTSVTENVPGLDFILKLRPVTYHFDAYGFEKFLGRPDSLIQLLDDSYKQVARQIRTGFIAQDVERAANNIGYDFSGIHKPTNEKDNYSLAYAEFTVPLVKAIQEQQALIEKQQAVIERLVKEVEDLKQITKSGNK
jgi:hypothetical protein